MKNLYKEQNLKRGDIILCNNKKRIFVTYIEGGFCPYVCVTIGDETNFKNDRPFDVTIWQEEDVSAKPKEWYEQIPEEGVICWVSAENSNERNTVAIIKSYVSCAEHPFISKKVCWKYATPIKPEECYKG